MVICLFEGPSQRYTTYPHPPPTRIKITVGSMKSNVKRSDKKRRNDVELGTVFMSPPVLVPLRHIEGGSGVELSDAHAISREK